MISDRLRAALGAGAIIESDGDDAMVRVDDVDRRYRDAIKSGARPLTSPTDEGSRRVGVLRDRSENGLLVRIWSPLV